VANAFGKTEVQLPNVPSGVYVVHYEQGDEPVRTKMVVAQY